MLPCLVGIGNITARELIDTHTYNFAQACQRPVECGVVRRVVVTSKIAALRQILFSAPVKCKKCPPLVSVS